MKKGITLIALMSIYFLSNCNLAFGQATTKEILDKFFEIYSKDPAKAVEYVFSTNKWMERKRDDIDNLKLKLRGLIDLCGDYSGYEKLNEKSAGESLKLVTYYLKYEREPIRITFFLYKPKDKWQVQNFSFNESIDDDLEEAAKLYRLKENYE